MTNLNELAVTKRDYDLESGFFWVEFENGESLQCCLKGIRDEDGDYVGYATQVEIGNSGFDAGLSWDCNQWAAGEDGEVGHIEDFLLEQARKAGLQIVA